MLFAIFSTSSISLFPLLLSLASCLFFSFALFQNFHITFSCLGVISLEICVAIFNSFYSALFFSTFTHTSTYVDEYSFLNASFVICHLRCYNFLSRISKWYDIDMESINMRRLKHPINAFKLTFTLGTRGKIQSIFKYKLKYSQQKYSQNFMKSFKYNKK